VTVSQLAVPVAVHAQPDPAVTWIVPVDPSAPTLLLVGATLNTQGPGVGVGEGVGSVLGLGAAC
jgi:hypothetical protein